MGREKQPFLFVGNHLALDFVNTQMIVKGEATDLFQNFEDLVSWLIRARLLTKSQADVVRAELNHQETTSLLDQAKTLRATLRVVAERIAACRPIPGSAIDTINRFLSQHLSYPQLVRTKGGFERHEHSVATQHVKLLAPLAEAASDLLCLPDFTLIKKCGNAACILYFYDTSKNHRRNWCSMQHCGNRMKVAAYFKRKRRQSKR